ncbi:MAG TPA: cupin domain-containing protein [Thiotrichales bacterium]|nr:cupin domain-containing protein [Thiotrichales bacterium]
MANLFDAIPGDLPEELSERLLDSGTVRIERIISRGHQTDWLDQPDNEWVMVLQGEARLSVQAKTAQTTERQIKDIVMKPGDYLALPAHTLHRVSWSTPDTETIWLAVHY